ncbi:hypothetical protein ALISP_4165 [Alicycliphilus sp. B1]|nr:hypothetical protein ALISP_4165 [Alicycliphilus sp. B1]
MSDLAQGRRKALLVLSQPLQEINVMSSHHDYIIEITAEHDALKSFAPENGQALRFAIGDAVIFTNEFGVQFRLRVTGFYRPAGLSGLYARGARYLLDSSSPWMPVSEASLRTDGTD